MRIFGKMIMAIALALVLSGTAAAGQKTFEKTFTVQPGGALSLGTDVRCGTWNLFERSVDFGRHPRKRQGYCEV